MYDEFEWIKSITPKKTFQSSLIQGIGDDAAVYRSNSEYDEVVCMDTMVEEIHFSRRTMKPLHIGYKSLAVNLSDIAAMGGTPLYYLVSISIPKSWKVEEINEIYKGMSILANQFHVDLIGGDTVSTKSYLSVTVTVIGRVKRNNYVLRSYANEGDIVFVTGRLGDAACGLSLLLERGLDAKYSQEEREIIKAHQQPIPQLECSKILQQINARHSLNDISDGLASEANEISEASQVRIILDYDKIPRNTYIKQFPLSEQFKWTLYGGEDYQLLGTVSKENWQLVKQSFKRFDILISEIGFVDKGEPGVYITIDDKTTILKKDGYNHFTK